MRIRVRATGAPLRPAAKGIDAAGAHVADSATNSKFAEAALRLLLLPAVPDRLEVLIIGNLKHFQCCWINALLVHTHLSSMGS
jgi:hypothetical protein